MPGSATSRCSAAIRVWSFAGIPDCAAPPTSGTDFPQNKAKQHNAAVDQAEAATAARTYPPIWRCPMSTGSAPELGFCAQGQHVLRRETWLTGGAAPAR